MFSQTKIRFYLTSSGRSPVEEFLKNQSNEIQERFVEAVSWLASGQNLSMPLARNLSGIHPGLHELRLRDRSGQIRVLYFMKKADGIYMVHAFRKKTQALPRQEIERALRRIREI
jgi:phage-related protein